MEICKVMHLGGQKHKCKLLGGEPLGGGGDLGVLVNYILRNRMQCQAAATKVDRIVACIKKGNYSLDCKLCWGQWLGIDGLCAFRATEFMEMI